METKQKTNYNQKLTKCDLDYYLCEKKYENNLYYINRNTMIDLLDILDDNQTDIIYEISTLTSSQTNNSNKSNIKYEEVEILSLTIKESLENKNRRKRELEAQIEILKNRINEL